MKISKAIIVFSNDTSKRCLRDTTKVHQSNLSAIYRSNKLARLPSRVSRRTPETRARSPQSRPWIIRLPSPPLRNIGCYHHHTCVPRVTIARHVGYPATVVHFNSLPYRNRVRDCSLFRAAFPRSPPPPYLHPDRIHDLYITIYVTRIDQVRILT